MCSDSILHLFIDLPGFHFLFRLHWKNFTVRSSNFCFQLPVFLDKSIIDHVLSSPHIVSFRTWSSLVYLHFIRTSSIFLTEYASYPSLITPTTRRCQICKTEPTSFYKFSSAIFFLVSLATDLVFIPSHIILSLYVLLITSWS